MKEILETLCNEYSLVAVKNKSSSDTKKLIMAYNDSFPKNSSSWNPEKSSSYSHATYFVFRRRKDGGIFLTYTGKYNFVEDELNYNNMNVNIFTTDELYIVPKGIKKKLEL